jgi:hypothetical protein
MYQCGLLEYHDHTKNKKQKTKNKIKKGLVSFSLVKRTLDAAARTTLHQALKGGYFVFVWRVGT